MKAIVYQEYGHPEQVMQMTEVNKPIPKENEVLIKVHATTINDYDWAVTTGRPRIYRLMFGVLKPKNKIAGMELSGTIEAIGAKVQSFKIGDAVLGDISNYGFGSFAEYITINEKAILLKPTAISFEMAAAIPHASLLALQGLVDIGEIQNGQRVLINGAGGGVGTIAVQIAKQYNCHITGVDASSKFSVMKELGYDHVIDYKTTDFTKTGERYDLILDCKSNRSAFAYRRALNKNGTYVTVGGNIGALVRLLFSGLWLNFFSNKKIRILSLKSNIGLNKIFDLIEQKKMNPLIDGPYSLEETPRLVQYFGDGKHTGKIVIKLC